MNNQVDVISSYIIDKNFEQALVLCKQEIQENGYSFQRLLQNLWCLFELGRNSESRLIIDKTLLESEEKQAFFNFSANFFLNSSEYKLLIDICKLWVSYFSHDVRAWQFMGAAYYFLGKYVEAEQAGRKSIAINATPSAEFNLGCTLLQIGKYDEGFCLYEKRIQAQPESYPINDNSFPFPRWQGQPLKGKTILVWLEQGIGDIIQFCRFIPLMAQQGAMVDLLLTKKFMPLKELFFTLEGINHIYTFEDNNLTLTKHHDYHCPLLSVMYGFSLSPTNIPASIPYLRSLTAHHTQWQPIHHSNHLKVGVVWSTNTDNSNSDSAKLRNQLKHNKSLNLDILKPIFLLEDISFVNLKFPLTPEEQRQLKTYNIIDCSASVQSFADTAAIIENLDVVISIDTAVAHLSGALARPTLTLLPYLSDWRWQEGHDSTPWYPTMSLYRQMASGEWGEAVEQLINKLQNLLADLHHR